MRPGDIVRLVGREGLFVYVGPRPGEPPVLEMGKFVNARNQSITIGIASATLVATASFTIGEVVTFQGGSATVVSDGENTVALSYGPDQVERAGGRFTQSGRCDADRAELVRQNLDKYITR